MASSIFSVRACHEHKIKKYTRKLKNTVGIGARPAGKHETNLVHEVGDVVDHVEERRIRSTSECANEVANRIDGLSNRNDNAHVVERRPDGV